MKQIVELETPVGNVILSGDKNAVSMLLNAYIHSQVLITLNDIMLVKDLDEETLGAMLEVQHNPNMFENMSISDIDMFLDTRLDWGMSSHVTEK